MKPIYFFSLLALLAIFSCHKESVNTNTSDQGQGGSLARFTVAGDYLYTVEMDKLHVFDIKNEQNPTKVYDVDLLWGVETIFAEPPYLFLGTRTGVKILSISNPDKPVYISEFIHIYSCDPVVVNGNIAYSTLNSFGSCGRGLNQLDIIDMSDIYTPQLIKSIQLTNPKGLGTNGNVLFVCNNGLEVYDITDKQNPQLIIKTAISAEDVIPLDTILLVGATDGLYQYAYNQNFEFELLSKLFSIDQ